MDIQTQILLDAFVVENLHLAIYFSLEKGPYHEKVLINLSLLHVFVACFEVTIHALWVRNYILGLRVVNIIIKLLKICCDNSIIVFFFSKNEKYSRGTKPMELKYFVIKKEV